MNQDEITINLRALTVDNRKALIKVLNENQKLVDDEVNQLAIIQALQFDNEHTPDYLSDFEKM